MHRLSMFINLCKRDGNGTKIKYLLLCVCLRLYLPYLPHNVSNRAPGCWTDSVDLTASQGSADTNKLSKVFVVAAGDVAWKLEDKAVASYSLLCDPTFTLPI